DLKELVPLLREQLDEGKPVSFVPRGKSMLPMLKGGEDMIILTKPNGRLHLFDVALYYRRETDHYVVHRVVGFKKDKTYVMLGDNNFEREYGITDDDVIGVVTNYYHKGKMRSVDDFSYKVYREFWYYTRPMRKLWRRAKLSLSKRIGKS
ncbi:MAG: S24/S26 family peptidase, partial [Ruminococcus sp.]|nr:S24/S26 family peptidase [Ruminococcus sp.]